MARAQDFISETRTAAKSIWDGINKLKALQREHTALDYGNTLEPGAGANAGITKEMVGSVLFDTTTAFEGVLNAGHATNVGKLLNP